MNYEDLLTLLEIEYPADLVYFEQFAELVENVEDISIEPIAQIIEGMERDVLSELTESYFEDVLKFIPDDDANLYSLLSAISKTLMAIAESGDSDDYARMYAEELYKFRNWYLFDGIVQCVDLDDNNTSEMTVYEALTNHRVQNIMDKDYSFDFSEALDYPLDEYIVSLSSLSNDDYDDYDDDDYDDYDDEDDYE